MSKKKLAGLLIAAIFACGCIFAVLQPSVSADPDQNTAEMPGDFGLCRDLRINGISYAVSVSGLEGLLGADYLADVLEIRDEASGSLLNEHYHIWENRAPQPVVSLFTEDGVVFECVDSPSDALLTIYTIGGADSGFAIVKTESVSYEDTEKVAHVRMMQRIASGAEILSEEEISEDTAEETAENSSEDITEDASGETSDEEAEKTSDETAEAVPDETAEEALTEEETSESGEEETSEVETTEENASEEDTSEEVSAEEQEPSGKMTAEAGEGSEETTSEEITSEEIIPEKATSEEIISEETGSEAENSEGSSDNINSSVTEV